MFATPIITLAKLYVSPGMSGTTEAGKVTLLLVSREYENLTPEEIGATYPRIDK